MYRPECTFRGAILQQCFSFPIENGSALRGNNLLTRGSVKGKKLLLSYSRFRFITGFTGNKLEKL